MQLAPTESDVEQDILSVEDLKTYFFTSQGVLHAVDGISFSIRKGESVGLVGESGSGKTMTAFSIMRLLPSHGRIVSGKINLAGKGDILSRTESEMREIRGGDIAMSFQDPSTFLNPVVKVGNQIAEAIILHRNANSIEAKKEALKLLKNVGIQSAEERYDAYPHQLSGGMKQRVLLAIAVSCNPKLLIADEPTTALDVIAQDQILALLEQLKAEFNTSMILITHDLAIASNFCDRLVIMYAGKIMEMGKSKEVFGKPLHPYTEALLRALPQIDRKPDALMTIEGSLPNMVDPPSGCRFHPRCAYAIERCRTQDPPLVDLGHTGHFSACIRASELYGVEASGSHT